MAKVGRPTDYKPEYCNLLEEHMAQDYSFESFAGIVKCHRDTLYEWLKVHPQFSDSYKRGLSRATLEGERFFKESIKNKEVNASLLIFWMKNRHGWRDKQEIEQTTNTNISFDKSTKQEIAEIVERLREAKEKGNL